VAWSRAGASAATLGRRGDGEQDHGGDPYHAGHGDPRRHDENDHGERRGDRGLDA
jgi:hypothetical protein